MSRSEGTQTRRITVVGDLAARVIYSFAAATIARQLRNGKDYEEEPPNTGNLAPEEKREKNRRDIS